MHCSTPDFLSFTVSRSLLKFMSIESVIPSNHLMLCCLLLLFPSIRVFSSELALCIRWPKYWSFSSASVLLVNIQGWYPLRLTDLISLLSKGLSRVFSSIVVWKHQFFGTQPSLWSNSHIHTGLLEKIIALTILTLGRKWYFYFLICYIGLSLWKDWIFFMKTWQKILINIFIN